MTDLHSITSSLGLYYDQWKQAEREKNDRREQFFEAVTTALDSEKVAAERLEEVVATNEEQARERLLQRHPDWTVEAIREAEELSDGEKRYEVILVENLALQPYTFLNPTSQRIFQRQISSGSPMLDDERLAAENPTLWKSVTTVPYETWIKNVMYHCGVDGREIDADFDEYLAILPDAPERKLRPLEELDDETLAELQEYVYYGKPTVRLSIRKAKPEELE